MAIDDLDDLRRRNQALEEHHDVLLQRVAAVEHMAGFLNDQWRKVYPAVTGRPGDWPHPMFGRTDWNVPGGRFVRPGERPTDWRGPGERPEDWRGGVGFMGNPPAPAGEPLTRPNPAPAPHPDVKKTFFGTKA
jgi:hypothetical protein